MAKRPRPCRPRYALWIAMAHLRVRSGRREPRILVEKENHNLSCYVLKLLYFYL